MKTTQSVARLLAISSLPFVSALAFAAPGTCTLTPDFTTIEAGEPVTLTATCTGTVSSANWKDGANTLTGDITLAATLPSSTPFSFTVRSLAGGSPNATHSITMTAGDPGTSNATTSNAVTVAVRGGPALTVATSGDGTGTVTSAPSGINCGATCSASFAVGSNVSLAAAPTGGSVFTGWQGDCTGSGSCVVGMQGARSVTAVFTANPNGACGTSANVATSTAPSSNLCASGTAGSVTSGASSFTWQCTAASGGTDASCSAPRQYTATVTSGAAGPNGTVSPASRTVTAGQSTTFTVTPDATYAATMGGTCSGSLSGNTYTIAAVTADCTVTASFSNAPINGACGSASGTATLTAPAANLCSAGSATTVTTGATAFTWHCDGINGGTNATSCQATRQFTASASSTGTGTITPSTRIVNAGATTTFTVTPGSGQGATMSGTCGGSLSGTTHTTSAITGDCTVVATFAPAASPTSDPGLFTGFWLPPGTTDYLVADQTGLTAAGAEPTITYVPGCLNRTTTYPSNVSSGCAIATSKTDTVAGGGSYTATLAVGKTIAIRFKSTTVSPSFTRNFKLLSQNGGNVNYTAVSMWISDTPGAGPETVPATCKTTSGTQPFVNIKAGSATACDLHDNTLYYINIRPDSACTQSGSGCVLKLNEDADFQGTP